MLSPMRRTTPDASATLQIDYRPDLDLLFAWVGDPEPARSVEVAPGVYVRVAPAGNRLLGIEILDCASRFSVAPTAVDAHFAQQKLSEFGAIALAKAQS